MVSGTEAVKQQKCINFISVEIVNYFIVEWCCYSLSGVMDPMRWFKTWKQRVFICVCHDLRVNDALNGLWYKIKVEISCYKFRQLESWIHWHFLITDVWQFASDWQAVVTAWMTYCVDLQWLEQTQVTAWVTHCIGLQWLEQTHWWDFWQLS